MLSFARKARSVSALCVLFAASALTPPNAEGQENPASRPALFGVDLSYVNEMEDCGGVYRENGQEVDPFAFFAERGANLVRIRLWHTPPGPYGAFPDARRAIRRAKDAGMQVLLDFHYSDHWADPGKQVPPAAWNGLTADGMRDSVYAYTRRALDRLADEGLLPEMVQIGNEINPGFLLPYGSRARWPQLRRLLEAGIRATRDAAEERGTHIDVVLHVAQPEHAMRWFAEAARAGLEDYDAMGISYYSQWSSVPLAELSGHIEGLVSAFAPRDLLVVETAYPWTLAGADGANNILGRDALESGYPATPAGQKAYLVDMTQAVFDGGGGGVAYWEPGWISTRCSTLWGQGSHWENATFFDFGAGNEALPGVDFMNHPYDFPEGRAAPKTPDSAAAQTLPVTFRYIPEQVFAERAFLPGSFNGWGAPYSPNTPSCIREEHASAMSFVRFERYWRYAVPLEIGATYEYKVQVHLDVAGADCAWLVDPLNPLSNPADNDNSVLVVTDPMIFQPAQEIQSGAFSAGLFSTQPFDSIVYRINGVEYTDGLDWYDADAGIFRVETARRIPPGAQFRVEAVDRAGRRVEAEIGRVLAPVEWVGPAFSTVREEAVLRARVTGLDGAIDPNIAQATLLRNGEEAGAVAVTDGEARVAAALEPGDNEFRLRLDPDGAAVPRALVSDPIVINRRPHPLDRKLVDVSVTGSGNRFDVAIVPARPATPPAPGGATAHIATVSALDDPFNTTDATLLFSGDARISGLAAGPGEVYVNLDVRRSDGETERRRIAVVIEEDGAAREMRYEETASWVRNAVVYEIFPFSFGPEASSGTLANPGRRLREITRELDYVARMGFNAIWFMPIMHNQAMNQVSGGYNIIDFYKVDPRLGTNSDFKALVARAHELGVRVILDITPNHVSPAHPWVASLRNGGPYGAYLQTEPSPHDLGLDGRGANLREVRQPGANYYKYDGFGDLANLDWSDDDLQADMLDALAFWVNEFDIDGWRLDAYWGPWRRYGPERFGRPVRTLMKRLKPDAWLLGEIAGTGGGAEVYYADALRGVRFEGGIDAGYDWSFYHNAVRGAYGRLAAYDEYARNDDFYPGPNARYFRFLENHDEPRIASLHASSPDRLFPLAGFLFTTTGVPMAYQGQEVAFHAGADPRRAPVNWNTPRNGEFARHYQRLAHARARFPAFGSQRLHTLTTRGAYAYVRPHADENAVVLVNFSSVPRTVTIDPGPHLVLSNPGPVPYYDIFADTSAVRSGAFDVTAPPYATVIYITSADPGFTTPPLPPLPYGAVYTAAERGELPAFVKLSRNYPNPFNPETTIGYTLPRAETVRLVVYDLLGREVARLADGMRPAGRHQVRFRAGELPSGMYVYRLETAGERHTRTMVLAK